MISDIYNKAKAGARAVSNMLMGMGDDRKPSLGSLSSTSKESVLPQNTAAGPPRSDGHILKMSTAVLKLSTAVLIANRQLRAPLAALNDRVRRRAMYRWKALFTHYILSQRTKPPYAHHQPVGQ